MAILALALLFRHSGMDFALAGGLVALYGVGTATGGPVLGRLVDYYGQPLVLVSSGITSAVAFVWIALDPNGPLPLVASLTFASGALTPPLEAGLRSLWPDLVPDDAERETAYSLDATLQELIFVTAPLLVALVAAIYYPMHAVVATAVITLLGAVAFASLGPVRRWRTVPRTTNWLGPLTEPRVRQVVICFLFVGAALGVLAIAAVAYAEEVANPDLSGPLLAANGGGAMVGGLSYGLLSPPERPVRRFRLLLAGLALCYVPLLIAPPPVLMAGLFFMAGVFLAPVLACTFGLLHRIAPPGTSTEAFAWLVSMFTLGSAGGTSLAGFGAEVTGARGALGVAVLAVAVACLLSLRVRTLVVTPGNGVAAPDPA